MPFKKTITSLIILGIIFFSVSFYFFRQNSQNNPKPPSFQPTQTPEPSKTSNSQYIFKSKGNHFDTYFPKNILDLNSDIKVEKGESSINFSLLSLNNKTVTGQMINKNQVIYPKISQSGNAFIDLRYTVSSDKISEEFILNQKQTFPIFKQKINLFNAYVANSSGFIQFNHPDTNKLLWYIPTPFMYEQQNPLVKHSGVNLKLTCDDPNIPLNNCRTLTLIKEITPEGQKWLDDPNRNYPVIIDPTVRDNCWGLGNLCDAGCVYYSLNASWTVYSTCTAINCSTAGCWGQGGSCDAGCTRCTVSSTTYYPSYSQCTAGTGGNVQVSGSNNCCAAGSGACYHFYTALSTWYGNRPTCGGYSGLYDYYQACGWYAGTTQYYYSVSNPVTRYTGGNAYCTPGSGNCYKLNGDGGNTYSSGNGCPSYGCNGSGLLYTQQTCSWYGELGGDVLRFSGVRLEYIHTH